MGDAGHRKIGPYRRDLYVAVVLEADQFGRLPAKAEPLPTLGRIVPVPVEIGAAGAIA
jgi:hypothetical protein